MPIKPTQPIIIPEKKCDSIYLQELVIRSPLDGSPTTVDAIMVPFFSDGKGNNTYAEDATIVYHIDDLFALAAGNAQLAQTVGAVLQMIQMLAQMDKKI